MFKSILFKSIEVRKYHLLRKLTSCSLWDDAEEINITMIQNAEYTMNVWCSLK